jgi:hypothetical protein
MKSPKLVRRAFQGLVGLPPEPDEATVVPAPAADTVVSEEEARAIFGVEKPEPKPTTLVKNMRQTLMLSPEDLIALFDEQRWRQRDR